MLSSYKSFISYTYVHRETLELTENKDFISNQSDKIVQLETNEEQNISLAIENSNQTDSDDDDNGIEDTSFDLKETLSSDEEDEKPLAEFITRSRKNFVEGTLLTKILNYPILKKKNLFKIFYLFI